MAEEQRPDPMQSFYLHQKPLPPRPGTSADDDDKPLRPLSPVKIRWQGLIFIVAFIALLAFVSRAFSPMAASILTVTVLLGLAAWAALTRKGVLDHGDGMWWGDGSDIECGGGGSD